MYSAGALLLLGSLLLTPEIASFPLSDKQENRITNKCDYYERVS